MAFLKKYKSCDECGGRNLIEAKFCGNCGKSFEEGDETPEEKTKEGNKIIKEFVKQQGEKVEVKDVDEKFTLSRVPSEYNILPIEVNTNKPYDQTEVNNS